MKCPLCNEKTKIVYSELLKNNTFRRYRYCKQCDKKFHTYESYQYIPDYEPVKGDTKYEIEMKLINKYNSLSKSDKNIFWEFLKVMDKNG